MPRGYEASAGRPPGGPKGNEEHPSERGGRPPGIDRDRGRGKEAREERFDRGRRGDRDRGEQRRDQRPRGQRGGGGPERVGQPGTGGGARTLKATVDKNRRGFGFLIFENRKIEDAFIAPQEAERLFHGDRVEVELGSRGQVVDIRVIEHRFRELVGRYSPHPTNKGGFVLYERKKAREEVYAPEGARAKVGDWVRARLEFHTEGPFPVTAEILEVYGEMLPASADVGMIAAEYNLVEEHPAAAEREARSFELVVDDWRTDLRHVPFMTIDGETARDFDDAIHVERDRSGYVLWVAIADVSHYVTPGSALDQDARSRGTSVYFPERAFHMLPRALSETLCSLRPDEDRLTLVARMELDHQGNRTRTELIEAVIRSQRRATYNEIEAEWKEHGKDRKWRYAPHFELYQQIRRRRAQRGSIDFDLPEAEVKVDKEGNPVSITRRERLDAHRLIEEFMISANEAVTEWIMERGYPFIYRVHDDPTEQALEKFERLSANMGAPFLFKGGNLNVAMADYVSRIEGHPAQALLNMQLLRSMKQAVYSSSYGGHFGLASRAYTHFTSPIRRYPDLVVHRMLRLALRIEQGWEKPLNRKDRDQLEKDLADAAEHCSYRERLAAEADREAIRLKQVRILLPLLGEELDGKIIGMAESGFFVQLDEPYAEGMVARESMGDDFYEFNEDRMVFFGRRKRRMFRISDRVKVRVVRADLERRMVDFALVEGPTATATQDEMNVLTRTRPSGGKKHRRDQDERRSRYGGGQGTRSSGGGGGGKSRGKRDGGGGNSGGAGGGKDRGRRRKKRR